MGINKLLERPVQIAVPELKSYRQRMAAAADELNRAGQFQRHLDHVTDSVVGLVSILYATDADHRPANIDVQTYRILIPLPWGEAGWRKWGLRRWEAGCLRRLLMERSRGGRRLPPLFDYSEFSRQWHINVSIYPDAEAALQWLKRDGPNLAEWRTVVSDCRAQASERMRRFRS